MFLIGKNDIECDEVRCGPWRANHRERKESVKAESKRRSDASNGTRKEIMEIRERNLKREKAADW